MNHKLKNYPLFFHLDEHEQMLGRKNKMRFHLSRRYKEATQYQSKIDNYFDRYLRMPDMLYTNYELLPGFCTPDERPFFSNPLNL
ncbi:TPA: hypothetical protein ACQ53F_002437 [Legionella pneumophila]